MRCSGTARKMSQGLPAVFQGEVGHTCLYRIKLMCPPLNDILCQKGETPGPFPTLPSQLLPCLLQAFLLCLLPFLTATVGLLFQLRNVRQMNIKITCGMGQHEQSVHYLNKIVSESTLKFMFSIVLQKDNTINSRHPAPFPLPLPASQYTLQVLRTSDGNSGTSRHTCTSTKKGLDR